MCTILKDCTSLDEPIGQTDFPRMMGLTIWLTLQATSRL